MYFWFPRNMSKQHDTAVGLGKKKRRKILKWYQTTTKKGASRMTRITYPACLWARWPDPPAWAPGWPHVALPATGRTGRRLPGRGRAAVLMGCEGSWGSATGHRISPRTIPADQRRDKWKVTDVHVDWNKKCELNLSRQKKICSQLKRSLDFDCSQKKKKKKKNGSNHQDF